MSSTALIATYGAILSTIAVGWNIYNNLQDRPKIKVIARLGSFMGTKELSKLFLFIKIVNSGRKSVHLSSFGLQTKKEDVFSLRQSALPFELLPGKSHDEHFDLDKLKDKKIELGWYRDEIGKMYKTKNIKKMLENYFESNKKGDSMLT